MRIVGWIAIATSVLAQSNSILSQEPIYQWNGSKVTQQVDRNVHSYELTLEADEFVGIYVRQVGTNTEVRLMASDGTQLLSAKSDYGFATQRVLWVNTVRSILIIQVEADGSQSDPASYEIWIEERRSATRDDRLRVQASMLLQQGVRGSVQNRAEAVKTLQTALSMFQSAGDRAGQASVLFRLGRLYMPQREVSIQYLRSALTFWPEALGYYADRAETLAMLLVLSLLRTPLREQIDYATQALPLYEALKDVDRQITTLQWLADLYKGTANDDASFECLNRAFQIATAAHRNPGSSLVQSLAEFHLAKKDESTALTLFKDALRPSTEWGTAKSG